MHVIAQIITTITLPLLLFYFFRWAHNHVRNYILLQKMPGPPRTGILSGNVTYINTDPVTIFRRFREAAQKYYPVYKLYAFHKGVATIISPEDCELILSNPIHNEKGFIYELLHKWLKFGLLTSSGAKWQSRRRILTPAFHFNILQQFILVFHEEAEKLVEVLGKQSGAYTEVTPHFAQFTLKTIAETAMGTKLNFESKQHEQYRKAIHDIVKMLLYRLINPFYFGEFGNLFCPYFFEQRRVLNTLHTFTADLIAEREKNFSDLELPKEEHDVYKGKKRLAMLDILLSAKRNEKTIDAQGIHEEVDTFMFEGHDTTSAALSFALMLLANQKHAQECIYQEMIEVLGDLKNKPTYNDLQKLKYMDRCIKECLRLYPSVHVISRTLGQDVELTSGHLLRKSSGVVIHIYDIHRNPEIYPDPDKFDPDRFLPENCQKRHPYAYVPFSAGPRNCIGQKFAMLEIKVVLWAILSHFQLEPVDTPETIEITIDLILKTTNPIKVKFVPRALNK